MNSMEKVKESLRSTGIVKKTRSFLKLAKKTALKMPVLWRAVVFEERKKKLPKVKAIGTKGMTDAETAIEEAIQAYTSGLSQKETDALKKSIVRYNLMMGVSPSEYFLFSFHEKNTRYSQRREFVSRVEKDSAMTNSVGMGDKYWLLHDKYRCYQELKKYYKRNAIKLTDDTISAFTAFCKEHDKIIAKPLDGGGGKDIHIIYTDSLGDDELVNKARELIAHNKSWMIEEVIVQDGRLAMFNESSVNTVRLFTRINSDGFSIFDGVFRMGRKGSDVDNASSGGVVALVDINKGVVCSDAIDKLNHTYVNHPDSGQKIKGFQLPCWDELKTVVESAHREIAPYPYIGWDFALSDHGWVVVEANWGHLLSQEVRKEGIRKEFYKCFE